MHTVLETTTSLVIPCTIMLFQTLAEMDLLMATTHRFISSSPAWIPIVSQLYVAVLFFYATIRSQNEAGHIDAEQREFLTVMEQIFDARTLRIPGPLVPFFQTLGASNGPSDRFGNVSFGIPSTSVLRVRQRNNYRFSSRVNFDLPNIIFLLDQLIRTLVTDPSTVDNSDTWYFNVFNVAANAADRTARTMYNPVARVNHYVSANQLRSFYGQRAQWTRNLPMHVTDQRSQYEVGNSQTILNLWQIIGFNGIGLQTTTGYHWFRLVATVMQPYTSYFRESVPFAAISPIGIGSVYIEARFFGITRNASRLLATVETTTSRSNAAVHRYVCIVPLGLQTVYEHVDDTIEALAEEYGMLCQLNANWTDINAHAPGTAQGPLRALTHYGPVFALPISRRSHIVEMPRALGANVAMYYHSQTQLPLS
jgi:hypothetical protein